MARMKIFNHRNAPEASRPGLKMLKEGMGKIPDMAGVAAASPPLVQAMGELSGKFLRTSLQPEECQLVLVAGCREYGNEYALELSSYMAEEAGLPEHVIEAIHEQQPGNRPWQDERYNALWVFVAALVAKHGQVGKDDIKAFTKAGFNDTQALEVALGVNVASLWCQVAGIAELKPERKFRWSKRGGFLGFGQG